MSIDFEWSDEPNRTAEQSPEPAGGRNPAFMLLTLVGLSLLLVTIVRNIRGPSRARVEHALTELLTHEASAFATGDGTAFFATQPADPAWQAAQLWPESLAMHRAGRTLQDFEQFQEAVGAQVVWSSPSGPLARTTFYHWEEGRLVPVASAPAFWGATVHHPQGWGTLLLAEADDRWRLTIASFVAEQIDRHCATGCRADLLPLTLELRRDYTNEYGASRVSIPSPHLIAVDANDEPGAPFWAMLDARLTDYLTPAALRFAVPAVHETAYIAAAQRFQRLHPDIKLEIVPFDDPTAVNLHAVDGALIAPSANQIAAGQLLDLTDFAAGDPTYAENDFHELLLGGVQWRERLWAVPIAGQWPLYQSDVNAHVAADLAPAPPATWAGLEGQIVRLASAPQNAGLRLAFADFASDSLLAIAGAHHCADEAVDCNARLTPAGVRSALSWYGGIQALQPEMPNFAAMRHSERRSYALNHLSRPREIAAWIEAPTYYEHNVQIAPLALAALPAGADATSTPIHVTGGVISASSDHPRDVWRWLIFLSSQRPLGEPRALPARASVTTEIGFWTQMPEVVRVPLLEGLVTGRAVRIDEREIFRSEILAALEAGESTLDELVQQALVINWFENRPQDNSTVEQ
jgi:hypothetical protein